MSQSLPMTPGIGFPPDSQVDLLRKLVWNTWLLAGGNSPVGPVVWVAAPASSSSAGTAGQIAFDSSYLYVCVAANTWRRTPIDDWS